MNKILTFVKNVDWLILLPAIFVAVVGFTIQHAILFKTKGVEITFSLETQYIALFAGIVAVFVFAYLPFEAWRRYSYLAYILAVLLLLLVLVIGSGTNGAQRWIEIGSYQLQPTEIAKLVLVLALARFLDSKTAKINRLRAVAASLILTAIPAALIVIQPDLGSAVVLVVIWAAMLLVSRIKLSNYALIIVAIATTLLVLTPFTAEYQQERLISYFNPSRDSQGANYNTIQSTIAIGSGGVLGNGLDSGSQSQLNFLPSQHTDFIFAVTSEKLGLLGALSVVMATLLMLIRMLYIGWVVQNQHQRLIVIGVVALLAFHAVVNIGMNLGLLPVTGLPLPLLSYGGSFMFTTTLAIGMVLIISYRWKQDKAKSQI